MHAAIDDFVKKWTDILKPKDVVWILGNEGETEHLLQVLRLRNEHSVMNVTARDNCYAFFSSPTDVARMESQTFICNKADAENGGPINNAWEYDGCLNTMTELLRGVMHDRTMYIIPFCLGRIGGKHSR